MEPIQDRETPEHGPLTRRQVLKTAGAGLVLLLPMFAEAASGAPDPWTNVGPAKQFPAWQPQRVALPNNAGVLYITRTGAKTFTGVSAKCTHEGCEVGWKTADKQFVCPCHGAVFGSSGKNIHGTARRPDQSLPPLAAVPTRQKGTQVQVNLTSVPTDMLRPGREG